MPDAILRPAGALASVQRGHVGAEGGDGPITLTAMNETALLHVLTREGSALGRDDIAAALSGVGAFDVRAAGPGQWFAVGDAPLAPGGFADIEKALAGKAHAVDQSHGRVRIAVAGKSAAAMLCKGIAVDLDATEFPVGRSVMTLAGHLGVLLTRTGDERFELMVLRGYALSLWESLVEMGLEFGVERRHEADGRD